MDLIARHIGLGVVALSCFLFSSRGWAGEVELGWTLPTENMDGAPLTHLAGAKVYYGTASSNYTVVIDVGLTNRYTVTGLNAGTTYYFNGTAYNTAGLESDFCNEVARIASGASGNQAPEVNAGQDCKVRGLEPLALDATVGDDGLPAGKMLTVTWSKITGPGLVEFDDSHSVDTTATFSLHGQYVVRLQASDGEKTSSDEVTVNALPVPSPPKNLRRIP